MTKKDNKTSKYNTKSERIKYKYRNHLRGVGQKDEKTIIAILRHIRDFEVYLDFEGFEKFNDAVAGKYIQHMVNNDLSTSYITGNIRAVKDFLIWLERQNGYRSKINYNDIEHLNISRNQRRAAKASPYKKAYTYPDILKAIRQMSEKTDKDKRDKAMVSLQALCTLRISELRTVKMRNVIEEDGIYFIDICPKDIQSKFAKQRQAVFIPLGEDILKNVISWYEYLKSLGFKDDDPLFPKINNRFNQHNLLEQSIKRDTIKSNTTIRNVFKKTFESAGFEYINPHSFRKTLARFAQTHSPAFMNAVRQNLGHSSIDTTLNSYGQLSLYDQRQIIASQNMI